MDYWGVTEEVVNTNVAFYHHQVYVCNQKNGVLVCYCDTCHADWDYEHEDDQWVIDEHIRNGILLPE
jgi:hypothetical protein